VVRVAGSGSAEYVPWLGLGVLVLVGGGGSLAATLLLPTFVSFLLLCCKSGCLWVALPFRRLK